MIKLIVFDWNGTLLADTEACREGDNRILREFGGEKVNHREYLEMFTIPGINFYALRGCDRERLKRNTKKLGEIFHDFYEPRAAKCRSRRGARALLKWLNEKKIEAIILSNHTLEGIEAQLKRLGMAGNFSKVIANSERESSMKERNKKKKLKYYIKTHKIKLGEGIIIGDSPEEIEIGKENKLITIAITDGNYSAARLRAARPDHLINNIFEVIDILKKITFS